MFTNPRFNEAFEWGLKDMETEGSYLNQQFLKDLNNQSDGKVFKKNNIILEFGFDEVQIKGESVGIGGIRCL